MAAGSDTGGARPPLLTCTDLCKFYGAVAAVNTLSFDVFEGECLGIGGPNGAGKTTLFDLISGLTPADSGEIRFDGRVTTDATPQALCHMGLARTFQLNAGFDTLTAYENVLVGAEFGHRNLSVPGLKFSRGARQRADAALDIVGMHEHRQAVVKHLPVYYRKLLMLAGALASEPKIIIMDEPVGGLNPNEIDAVMSVVERVRAQAVTIVLIEHVMRFLVALSDRVMIMHHGEKIYEGPADGLAQDKTVVEVYLGEAGLRLEPKGVARP